MKKCNCCKQMLEKEKFQYGKNVCKKCVSLQKYHPEEFLKKYPNYLGRKKKQYNIKFGERYAPPQPPDDMIRCLNSINDTLSMMHVELKEMSNLMRDLLYNNR